VTGIEISYGRWALGAIAPALVSMLVVLYSCTERNRPR
jgi:hypothetical protein